MLISSKAKKRLLISVNCSAILEPKFSVIIPTYNRSATLGRAIQSVLGQTLPAWEIIVVDDGSLDDSRELVKTFPQVRYHYQANSGVCAARNKGAEIATGDWLIFLDSDDELMSGSLKEFSLAIKSLPLVQVVLSGFLKIDSKIGIQKEFPAKQHLYSPPLSGTFAITKGLFIEVGLYDTNLGYAENMELFLRLGHAEVEPKVIESISLKYYESIGGGSKNLEQKDLSLTRILTKHGGYLASTDLWNLYQTLGVIQLKRGRFSAAKSTLKKAISFRPTHLATYLRLMMAYLPFLSRRIYTSSSFTE